MFEQKLVMEKIQGYKLFFKALLSENRYQLPTFAAILILRENTLSHKIIFITKFNKDAKLIKAKYCQIIRAMIVFRERFVKVVGQEKASNSFNALEGKDIKVNEIIMSFEESTLLNEEVLMAHVFSMQNFLKNMLKVFQILTSIMLNVKFRRFLCQTKTLGILNFNPKGTFQKSLKSAQQTSKLTM